MADMMERKFADYARIAPIRDILSSDNSRDAVSDIVYILNEINELLEDMNRFVSTNSGSHASTLSLTGPLTFLSSSPENLTDVNGYSRAAVDRLLEIANSADYEDAPEGEQEFLTWLNSD
jgi:hypothetical protein